VWPPPSRRRAGRGGVGEYKTFWEAWQWAMAVVGRAVAAATVPHSWPMSGTHIMHAAVGHGTRLPLTVRARRSGRRGMLGWRAAWPPPSPAAPSTPQTTRAAEAYRQLAIAVSGAVGSSADIVAPQPAGRKAGFLGMGVAGARAAASGCGAMAGAMRLPRPPTCGHPTVERPSMVVAAADSHLF